MISNYISNTSRAERRNVHPFAALAAGVAVIILGLFGLNLNFSNPIDTPKEIQAWPSILGTVVRTVEHPEANSLATYDVTIRYDVNGSAYYFVQNVSSSIQHSTVKYDPQTPSHFHRVSVREELGIGLIVLAIIALLTGAAAIAFAAIKMRRGDRSFNKPMSAAVSVLAVLIGIVDLCLFMDPSLHRKDANSPYGVASQEK